MKKLMFTAAALMAGIAVADIQSSNVVGYLGKDAEANLNWYTPQFLGVGQTTTDINAIKLDDGGAGMVGWGDVLQIAGPLGSPAAAYLFWDPSMDPNEKATECYWGDGDCNPVDVSFDKAAGFAFDNMNAMDFKIVDSGEVIAEDVRFAAQPNLNWFGNPYPTAININAISLDDDGAGMVGWGDVLQIAGPLGSPAAAYLFWDPSMDPNEKATGYYWGDGDCNPVDITFQPGDAFAIDNMNAMEFDIIVKCPYSL